MLLRLARGDVLPRSPFERPQTRFQDLNLLFTLRLVEQQGATLSLTPLGVAYLERVEAEQRAGPWPDAFAVRGSGRDSD